MLAASVREEQAQVAAALEKIQRLEEQVKDKEAALEAANTVRLGGEAEQTEKRMRTAQSCRSYLNRPWK